MKRRLPSLLLACALGLGAGWWLGRRGAEPPLPAPGSDPASPAAPPPHARGEPADAAPGAGAEPAVTTPSASSPAAVPEPLAPIDCALDFGPTPPTSLRVSWRSIVLGDPAVAPAELLDRIRDRARTVPVGPGGLRLELPRQADVLLVMDGARVQRAYPLTWEEAGGRCVAEDELFPTVRVSGRVAGLRPGDEVQVFLCGEWLDVDAQGRFSGTAPAVAPCLAFAARQDGMLTAMGGLVDLDLSAGGLLDDLELDLPDYEMAGVGAALAVLEGGDQGGVEVLQALPGGPAEVAGLQQGDLILQVDGEDVDGWELSEVVAAITGPEGTEVELLVEDAQGQRRRVPIVRQTLPTPADEDADEDADD